MTTNRISYTSERNTLGVKVFVDNNRFLDMTIQDLVTAAIDEMVWRHNIAQNLAFGKYIAQGATR